MDVDDVDQHQGDNDGVERLGSSDDPGCNMSDEQELEEDEDQDSGSGSDVDERENDEEVDGDESETEQLGYAEL
jgi:hypothetical protein